LLLNELASDPVIVAPGGIAPPLRCAAAAAGPAPPAPVGAPSALLPDGGVSIEPYADWIATKNSFGACTCTRTERRAGDHIFGCGEKLSKSQPSRTSRNMTVASLVVEGVREGGDPPSMWKG
jgi:hypothetical protein